MMAKRKTTQPTKAPKKVEKPSSPSPFSYVEIDGKQCQVKATLGALAEIQAIFGLKDITQLDRVFSKKIDINKMIAFVEILLRAGGNDNSEQLAKEADMTTFQAIAEVFNPPDSAGDKNPT